MAIPSGRHPTRVKTPYLILDFTWSGLNKATDRKATEEVMWFRGTLHRSIIHILTAEPRLGPAYLGKLDLADAYMWLWSQIEYTPSLYFLPPKKTPEYKHLVGFHLSLHERFADSMPYFCMASDRVANLVNASMDS